MPRGGRAAQTHGSLVMKEQGKKPPARHGALCRCAGLLIAGAAFLAGSAHAADGPPPVPVVVTTARSEKVGASLQATGTVVSRNDARISGEAGGGS